MSARVEIPNNLLLEEVAGMLSEGESVVIRAKGRSMSPFVRDGIDSLELVRADAVNVNDIVLARIRKSGMTYVIHRVIGKSGGLLTLMGDGNLASVEETREEDVMGKVAYIIRPDGRKVDVNSAAHVRKAVLWRRLRPVRRILLAVWKRLPRSGK